MCTLNQNKQDLFHNNPLEKIERSHNCLDPRIHVCIMCQEMMESGKRTKSQESGSALEIMGDNGRSFCPSCGTFQHDN